MVFLLMFKYGKRVVQIEKWTGGGKSTLLSRRIALVRKSEMHPCDRSAIYLDALYAVDLSTAAKSRPAYEPLL